jgi:hypothetical protein
MDAMSDHPRRLWLVLATLGCVFVVLAMIASALVLLDKPHFGWMVGSAFLAIISSGVIAGGLLVLIASAGQWRTWRGIVLIVWGLIAVTSPLFGFLFLLPWSILVLMLPLVIVVLAQQRSVIIRRSL